MRLLYTLLLTLLTPLIVLRLMLKGFQLPAYRARIAERFGFVPIVPEGVAVWVHAVSVGESLAALPLINRLIALHGECRVWVTTTTPTGSERVRAALGDRVIHTYAPYDLPSVVARFLRRAKPQRVVVMETELWPNLFHALHARGIPLLIANARLSPRSFKGYGRVAGFAKQVLSKVSVIAAQSRLDGERFHVLGAPDVRVIGNLKFDLAVPEAQLALGQQWAAQWGAQRRVWAAVSTHPGEEQFFLDAQKHLVAAHPDVLLVLVPRHPQRFDDLFKLIEKMGLRGLRRSNPEADFAAPPQVVLGDSMGEMFAYLEAAQVVFVAGSLAAIGGHNVLEPAALAKPVLFGRHMDNFLAARELLLGCGAALEVPSLSDGYLPMTFADEVLLPLLTDLPRQQRMGIAGRDAVVANRGALERLLELLA